MGLITLASLAALGGWFVTMALRRWAQRDEHAENFTVQDLRDMRARGDITEREFVAMRRALLAEMGARIDGGSEIRPPDPEGNSERED